MAKLHTIIVKSNRRDDKVVTDNLENLISYFGYYTLEVGQSW